MSVVAERLVAARTIRGLPAMTVSDRSGIAPAQLSIYESGRYAPNVMNLARLADALDVDADFLIGRTMTPVSRSDATSKLVAQISALAESDRRLLELFLDTVKAVGRGEEPNAILKLRARIEAARQRQKRDNDKH